jgi:hypothetical protein
MTLSVDAPGPTRRRSPVRSIGTDVVVALIIACIVSVGTIGNMSALVAKLCRAKESETDTPLALEPPVPLLFG